MFLCYLKGDGSFVKVIKAKSKLICRCDECLTTIKSGNDFVKISFNDNDGKWISVRICKKCFDKKSFLLEEKNECQIILTFDLAKLDVLLSNLV